MATSGAPLTSRSSTPDTQRGETGGGGNKEGLLSGNIFSYKAGHSIWKTRLSSIDEEPVTNSHLHIYDVNTKKWMKYPEDPPFRISGGATVWHLNSLYLIGGYTVEYDCELKCFYQSPSHNVWIFDPSLGTWSQGPPLPKESFVAKNKTIKFRGYCLGGLAGWQHSVHCIDN